MKQRCLNPNHESYHNYGGRGITICPSWIGSFEVFARYIEDALGLTDIPRHLEIDRIDNDKGYEPGNIKLSTRKEQANNRRTNHLVRYNGEEMTLQKAAETSGLDKATLHRRINLGEADPFRPVKDASILFRGNKTTISELARETGIPRSRLSHRIRIQGLSPEEAISSDTWKGKRTDLNQSP